MSNVLGPRVLEPQHFSSRNLWRRLSRGFPALVGAICFGLVQVTQPIAKAFGLVIPPNVYIVLSITAAVVGTALSMLSQSPTLVLGFRLVVYLLYFRTGLMTEPSYNEMRSFAEQTYRAKIKDMDAQLKARRPSSQENGGR